VKAVEITIEPRSGGFVAYLSGKSSPVLRPVPGNTHAASAAFWLTKDEAKAELPAILPGVQIIFR